MKERNYLLFLKRILFSSLFLWIFLLFLSQYRLMIEIKISFFFFLFLLLFLIIYLKQILIFLIFSLNEINLFLKTVNEKIEIKRKGVFILFSLFFYQFLKFLLGLPKFLKFILGNYFFWLSVTALGIFLDIFVFKFTSDFIILFFTGLWILVVRHYKFEGRVSIGLALGFLILCPFLLILKQETVAEKASIWTYMFLVVGVVQEIWSLRDRNK